MLHKNIVIGVREDNQTQEMAKYAHLVFFWDDFLYTWDAYCDGEIFCIEDKKLEKVIPITSDSHLYIRHAQNNLDYLNNILLMINLFFGKNIVGCSYDFYSNDNKLTQLRLFGKYAPLTYVTNLLHRATKADHYKITKSISWVRSNVCFTKHFIKKSRENLHDHGTLHIPIMIQEFLPGTEYKGHFLKTSSTLKTLNIGIDNVPILEGSVDYRYNNNATTYHLEPKLPQPIRYIVNNIFRNHAINFIDVDYVIHNKMIKVLEWNDSPAPICFEKYLPNKDQGFCQILLSNDPLVLIYSRNDRTGTYLKRQLLDDCYELFLEDYLDTWEIQLTEQTLTILTREGTIIPKRIYLRSTDDDTELSLLFHALEWGKVEVIGATSLSFINGSKPLQLSSTLVQARSASNSSRIQFPKTWCIKGIRKSQSFFSQKVIKSISGVRSIVVAENTFHLWDYNNLHHNISHFQTQITGLVIRVHVIRYSRCIALKCTHFKTIDHRYDSSRSKFSPFELPDDVKHFCQQVAQYELNPLCGIDFILTSDGIYYCLEVNPQPGLSWYATNAHSSKVLEQAILEYLLDENV